jgi:hypothetical protein
VLQNVFNMTHEKQRAHDSKSICAGDEAKGPGPRLLIRELARR